MTPMVNIENKEQFSAMDKESLLTVVDSINERIFPGISKNIPLISTGRIAFGIITQ